MKDYKTLRRWLVDQGYQFANGRGGHQRLLRPNGSFLMSWPSSPSEWRSLQNDISQLRRAGVAVPR